MAIVTLSVAVKIYAQESLVISNNSDDPDYKEALKQTNTLYERAKNGDAEAQYILGDITNHLMPNQDYKENVIWFRKAAEQGHAKAQFSLGMAYHEGTGVDKDDKQAIVWLQKSAAQGNAEAQKALDKLQAK